MEWLAKKFKKEPEVVLGIYAVVHGATDKHIEGINALAREVMQRMGVDEKYQLIFQDLFVWTTCMDQELLNQAMRRLRIRNRELTLMAKGMMSPKDLPSGFMTQRLKF